MKRFDHLFKVGALGAGILALSALGGGTQGCGGDGGTGGTGGSGGGTGGDGGTGGGGGAKPSYCGFNADRLAICGDVKSAAGGALKGATVRLDGQVTTTAADGSFKIDASLGGTHVLWLEAAGFSPLTTVVTESSEGRSFTLAPIVEITVQNLGASIGITDPFSGATVTVDPADLIDEKGDPIAPPIMVGIHYINPALQPLPGDDGAIDVNSMPTYLKSYGALYVEARYPDGTKISLKPGAQAEVKIPIPKDRLDFAPGTLPLWVFDSTAGVWREQPGGGLQQTPNAVQPPCKEVPTCNGAGCSALSTSAFVGSSPSLGFVNADVAQTDKPACLRIEIDGAAVAAADLPVCIHLVGPVGSPVTQAHRGCFNAGVGVYYNLPPNVDVTIERLVDIGCLPAPGGTSVIVNTGASWGGQGYPPSASVCNGVLSIPPLP